ncbi:hypothetical protein IFR05_011155 [Cadophora sp. M221]|nr:hypothetical protein IFR05_011155 [Cadophora sp. M221]
MSANQCTRNPLGVLGKPLIYESFSVCSLRWGGWPGLTAAVTECCADSSTIKNFQCWNYCPVEESAFPTWLRCVATAINNTEGAYCQRADESPVSTATSFPVSHQQPVSPPPYNWPVLTTTATTTTQVTEHSSVVATTTDQRPDLAVRAMPTAGSANTSINGTAPPTQLTGSAPANIKRLQLSMGGLVCALLALSVFAL